MFSLLRRVSLVLCLALGACNSLPPAPIGDTNFVANQQALESQKRWSLQGRLNLRQGSQSDTVSINWQQQDASFDIVLRGALGIGSTRVFGSDQGLTVEKSGEKPIQLPNLQALTRDYLGFEFPAAYLIHWVRGLPVPAVPATPVFDEHSRLATLVQQDKLGRTWQLSFDQYREVGTLVLPGRIRMENADVKLTFVVSDWLLGASSP